MFVSGRFEVPPSNVLVPPVPPELDGPEIRPLIRVPSSTKACVKDMPKSDLSMLSSPTPPKRVA